MPIRTAFHPGARFFLFPEIPRGLQKKPRRQQDNNDHDADQDCTHSLSNAHTGNGLLTLLAMKAFRKLFLKRKKAPGLAGSLLRSRTGN